MHVRTLICTNACIFIYGSTDTSLVTKEMTNIPLQLLPSNRLVGLVVKACASRAEDPGFESRLRRDFFGVESYQ